MLLPYKILRDEALINRSTFYLHFYDKQDLLEKLTEGTFEELKNLIRPTSYVQKHEVIISNLEMMIQQIFENIDKNIQFYRVMLGNKGIYEVNNKLQKVIKNKFKEEFLILNLEKENLTIPLDLVIEFMATALTGMIRWWILNDQIYSPKHMSKNLVRIITRGPLRALGLDIEKD